MLTDHGPFHAVSGSVSVCCVLNSADCEVSFFLLTPRDYQPASHLRKVQRPRLTLLLLHRLLHYPTSGLHIHIHIHIHILNTNMYGLPYGLLPALARAGRRSLSSPLALTSSSEYSRSSHVTEVLLLPIYTHVLRYASQIHITRSLHHVGHHAAPP